jgi:hypothetical protein
LRTSVYVLGAYYGGYGSTVLYSTPTEKLWNGQQSFPRRVHAARRRPIREGHERATEAERPCLGDYGTMTDKEMVEFAGSVFNGDILPSDCAGSNTERRVHSQRSWMTCPYLGQAISPYPDRRCDFSPRRGIANFGKGSKAPWPGQAVTGWQPPRHRCS